MGKNWREKGEGLLEKDSRKGSFRNGEDEKGFHGGCG
jgi:hypothetical protein